MAVDYGFRIVPFVLPTTTGNFDVEITSSPPGKTPKLVMIFVSRATALDTVTNEAMVSVGAYDGSNSRCVSAMAENGTVAANADTGGRIDNGAVVQIPTTGSEAKEARVTAVSFASNKVTLNIATGEVPSSAYRSFALFMYGADLTAGVLDLTSSSSLNGDVSTTVPGVKPDGIVSVSADQTFSSDAGFAQARLCVGFAGRSSSGNACASVTAEDRRSNTSSGVESRDDACVATLTSSAGTVSEDSRVKVQSFDTTGFTIRSLVARAVTAMYVWFNIGGRSVYVGLPSLAANVSGNTTDTSPGFLGSLVMFAGQRVANADTVGNTQGNLSVGAATASEQALVSWNDNDNQGTSSTKSLTSNANLIDVVDTAHDWTADFVAFTSTGYTYHVSDTTAAARPTAVMVVQAAPQDVAPTGIASASAFGTAKVSMQVRPTGIASTSSFGTPKLNMQVRPSGVASASAFGSATVLRGAVTVFPTGIASASAFGTAALSLHVLPSGLASASAFGAPRVGLQVRPTGLASASTFGTASVTARATIAPAGIASAGAFGTATVSSRATVAPAGIASSSAFGAPRLTLYIRPAGLASSSAIGSAVVTNAGSFLIQPAGLASASAFGSATVLRGGVTVAPVGLATASAFGLPVVLLSGNQVAFPVGLATASAFGLPVVRGGDTPVTLKKRIQEALHEAAFRGMFIQASYPVEDEGAVLQQGTFVGPASIEVNEVKNGFQPSARFGRGVQQGSVRWLWLLILRFEQEVIAEEFEQALQDAPICVPRIDNGPTSRQAILYLVDCDYKHPPRGNPSNGSEIRYRFEAALSP